MKQKISLHLFFIGLFLSTNINTFAENKPVTVSTTALTDLLVNSTLSAPANIISLNHSIISAEIMGRALRINVEAGDTVSKGQKLASLDCRSYLLARKQANAALKVANTQVNYSNKQLQRNKSLVKKGIIPRDAFDKIEASLLTARADIHLKKASIETANLAISRCQINAPFSGQITNRLVQQGQLVTAGTPLFKLMQTEKVEIKARLSPADVIKLRQSPLLTFVAGDIKLKTTIRSIIQNIDESTKTQEVRLSLQNNAHVAAGLSGRIEWNDQEPLLPAEYIVRRGNKLGIMLAVDITDTTGKAKFYPLPMAQEGQASTVNLPKDTNIITLNRFRVKDGNSIKIQK